MSHKYKSTKSETGDAQKYEYDTFIHQVVDKDAEIALRVRLNVMAAQGWYVVISVACRPTELLFVMERMVPNG